jgi:hypothetical protein
MWFKYQVDVENKSKKFNSLCKWHRADVHKMAGVRRYIPEYAEMDGCCLHQQHFKTILLTP